MHESRLVADLVKRIDEEAVRSGARRVQEVRIEIGALSHVTPESLRSHMELAAHGTTAETATFVITKMTDHTEVNALDVRLVSITVEDG
ncbi:MAG: hydrogenase maturation nickel metallochaperone HypA [Actinomycetia bacterium]|nr:hydrogenase maturation nickel metallochaperone HypA [Actinomycetes bacterium]